jgi:hypothetical protein
LSPRQSESGPARHRPVTQRHYTVTVTTASLQSKVSQVCRRFEVIGAEKTFAPRSSRTAMKFPGLAKLGLSVPMRCARYVACVLASLRDEHSCPIKSWARISPAKSKKNRFMIAQPGRHCCVPKKASLVFEVRVAAPPLRLEVCEGAVQACAACNQSGALNVVPTISVSVAANMSPSHRVEKGFR